MASQIKLGKNKLDRAKKYIYLYTPVVVFVIVSVRVLEIKPNIFTRIWLHTFLFQEKTQFYV